MYKSNKRDGGFNGNSILAVFNVSIQIDYYGFNKHET